MDNIKITINGLEIEVPANATILEAAHMAHIEIPTLCYMKDLNEIGACRMCVVEVKGAKSMATACVYPVSPGMEIYTNTEKVREARKKTLELMLSNHNRDCLSCVRAGNCELMQLSNQYGVKDLDYYSGAKTPSKIDDSCAHMIRDNSKCILCRRCVAVCSSNQAVAVIGPNSRGFNTYIGTAFDMPLAETACVNCGQCIAVCPTGALVEKDYTAEVFAAIQDPAKHVVVQTAPAVRAALGECFDMPIGTNVEGKMVAALRRLGFDKVFDTNYGADLTIMEEANELVERIQNGGKLPMITSCSPGWVKFCEHYFPDMTENLSSCKSPQQMFGAICKSYYAKKNNIDPKDIVVVSIMPCTAKKFEIGRPDQDANGVPDVDYALTTREFARMIKTAGIIFANLPDELFDDPLGDSSGAGAIFGATGGVMEAALRTAVETITGEKLDNVNFTEVRGVEAVKEATYEVGGLKLKVAVVSGLSNAQKLLEKVRSGEADYQFIEVMACPGGCVNGGGQPQVPYGIRNFVDIRAERAKALYAIDEARPVRKSHENPFIKALYDEYLGKPGSHEAHHLLHTTYVKRSINKKF